MTRAAQVATLCLWLGLAQAALAVEVGMVTGLQGTAQQIPAAGQARALQAFAKIESGERLRLAAGGRLQLVLFHSGEEQVWSGPAELQLLPNGSQRLSGAPPQVRQLPKVLVKQLARTPAADGQVRAGMVRLRNMPSGGTLESVEKNYDQLRRTAAMDDRNPELYLLAGYFELREFERLQQLLVELDDKYPGDREVDVLRALYTRAMNNAKVAAEQ